MKGLDGIQGPVYVGTGCVFRRQALYGYGPPKGPKRPKMVSCDCCPCFGRRKKTTKYSTSDGDVEAANVQGWGFFLYLMISLLFQLFMQILFVLRCPSTFKTISLFLESLENCRMLLRTIWSIILIYNSEYRLDCTRLLCKK